MGIKYKESQIPVKIKKKAFVKDLGHLVDIETANRLVKQGDGDFVYDDKKHLRVHSGDIYHGFTFRKSSEGDHYKYIGEVTGPEHDL